MLRLYHHLTMEKTAKIVGIAKSTYAGYESEFRQPSLDKITLFADYYDVSVDYIVGLTDQRERNSQKKFDTKDLLSKEELHWDGIPLSEEEVKQMKDFLRVVAEKNKGKKADKKSG